MPDLPPGSGGAGEPAPFPPKKDPGVTFTWNQTRGILTFGGTNAEPAEITSLVEEARSRGWRGITFNTCAETSFWDSQGTPWAANATPDPFDGEENLEQLERYLDATASAGVQVLLNVYCTVRDEPRSVVPDARFFRFARTVAGMAGEYNHVHLSVANEWWHRSASTESRLRAPGAMERAISEIRASGYSRDITSDSNFFINRFGEEVIEFDSIGGRLYPPTAHPWRSPNPTKSQLRRMAQRYPDLVITEPTAYSTTRGGGCCTADRAEIVRYMCDAEFVGIIWFYHSTDGLGWPNMGSFEWLPRGVC
jgi:hypothetical protein